MHIVSLDSDKFGGDKTVFFFQQIFVRYFNLLFHLKYKRGLENTIGNFTVAMLTSIKVEKIMMAIMEKIIIVILIIFSKKIVK